MPSGFTERPIAARQQKSRDKEQKHGLAEEWGVPHAPIVVPSNRLARLYWDRYAPGPTIAWGLKRRIIIDLMNGAGKAANSLLANGQPIS